MPTEPHVENEYEAPLGKFVIVKVDLYDMGNWVAWDDNGRLVFNTLDDARQWADNNMKPNSLCCFVHNDKGHQVYHACAY